jgi:F-type H+-transporting ATPase subunit a
MSIFQLDKKLPQVQPETLFRISELPVTNAMFSGVVISMIFIIAVIYLSTKLTSQKTPSGFQVISELTVEKFQSLIKQITGDKKTANKLLPLVGAILLYFGLGNIITLFPGLNAINFAGTSMFRGPTNDFNTVFSVALGVGVLSQIGSIKKFGLITHIGKYIKIKEIYQGFKKSIGDGFLGIIEFFIGILDIISEFAKVISLAVRIFGNMLAGLTLLTVLWGAFALVVPAAWMALSLLFGIIHALVFGALTAAYYTLAVSSEQV